MSIVAWGIAVWVIGVWAFYFNYGYKHNRIIMHGTEKILTKLFSRIWPIYLWPIFILLAFIQELLQWPCYLGAKITKEKRDETRSSRKKS